MSQNTPPIRCITRTVVASCLLLLLLPALASAAAAQQKCANPAAFYSKHKYKIRRVYLKTPLDFMQAISSSLEAVRPKLPLQPGGAFTLKKLTEGRDMVREAMKALEEDDPLAKALVVLADPANCDDESGASHELDVYYWVFTTNYNSYLSHTFEVKNGEVERPASATAETEVETQTKGSLKVQPFVKYNRSRQLFGGGRARLRMPGGIFDAADVSAGDSVAGNEQKFEMSGSRSPQTTAVNELQYRFSYRHSDLPAGANRLREGVMQAQLFGATKSLGSKGIVLRYGASLEGGNQHTDLDAAAAAAGSVADSGYGSLKTYLGATMRTREFSLAVSYGLQLGTRGATTDLDFVKHVGDAAFDASWILNKEPGEFHSAFTLETRLSGGAIKTLGVLPVSQRFFGGNVAREFIEGDAWVIRGGPYIRSIPENRLDSGSTFGGIGGTGFYSANVTVGLPVWGKPLIPAELAKSTDSETGLPFSEIMNGMKESARQQFVFSHLNEIPAFAGLIAEMQPVNDALQRLEGALASVPITCQTGGSLDEDEDEDAPPDTRSTLEKIHCAVNDSVVKLRDQLKDDKETRGKLPSLLRDILKSGDSSDCASDPDELPTCSALTTLRVLLERWAGALRPADFAQAADTADSVRALLAEKQPSLVKAYEVIDKSPEKKKAEDLGTADMKQLEPVIDSFVNELNRYAVGPVFVFDAARVWPDRNGTRYGVGGGVRLSVINFNVTLGYSFNPSPKLREGRGALFFSMDVTDLFR